MDKTEQVLKVLGRRIACLRKERGMNQDEFADVSGKMINTISNIERGLSDPKVTTLLSLAQALNVPVDKLFNDMNEHYGDDLSENVFQIVELIKNEDSRIIDAIKKQVEALLELVKG